MQRLSLALLIPLLAACAGSPPATSVSRIDPSALAACHWQLSDARDAQNQRIDALFVRADAPLRLNFQQGRANIDNACNRISGAFNVVDDKLEISQMAATRMACIDPAISALDQAISARLQGALSARHVPQTLTLNNAAGDTLVFRCAEVAGTN
jgi:heat shock protein HslJ